MVGQKEVTPCSSMPFATLATPSSMLSVFTEKSTPNAPATNNLKIFTYRSICMQALNKDTNFRLVKINNRHYAQDTFALEFDYH